MAVTDLGPTQLKNIERPIRVYSLQVGVPATPSGHDAFYKSYVRFVDLVQQHVLGGVRIFAEK